MKLKEIISVLSSAKERDMDAAVIKENRQTIKRNL
jgi:hypothetical protein